MAENGPRVAIFGATSGIAVEIARRYAGKGARLVLVGRNETALGEQAADLRVRGAGEVATLTYAFDSADAARSAAEESWSRFGGLDVAIVAFGSLPDQVALQKDIAGVEAALVVNFVAPSVLVEALAGHFEAQRSGAIAVITSVAGDRGRASNYFYGAAKGGLQRFVEGVRHRLHAAGVAVVDIRPGFVRTKMTEHLDRNGPLWADPGKVADDITAAIEKRRSVVYTPGLWAWIMLVVRSLPRPIFHRTKF